MANLLSKARECLDGKDIKYEMVGDEHNAILMYQGLENTNVRLRIIVFPGEDNIQIKFYDMCTVNSVSISFLKKLNQFNGEYRWVQIYMDDDNDVTLSLDAYVDEYNVGQVMLDLMIMGLRIAEDLYPKLMKAIWA